MHIKTKSKESLKALYNAFESVITKMNTEVQERFKEAAPERSKVRV